MRHRPAPAGCPRSIRPGFDDSRLAAVPRSCRSTGGHQPTDRAAGPRVEVLPGPCRAVARPGTVAARRRPEHRGVRAAAGAGAARARGDRASRRGARARRLAPHQVAAVGEGDRHVHPRRRRGGRCSSRAFTFHGFRYAEVETSAEILGAEFVAISSDTPRRGWFDVLRSALGAAARERRCGRSGTTSCRCPPIAPSGTSGWAGRAMPRRSRRRPAPCSTPQAFWASWLRDLALEQDDVLGVPSVVPDVVLEWRAYAMGRAGWADAATIVPVGGLRVRMATPRCCAAQLPSMRRWVHVAGATDRTRWPAGRCRAWQFGDWLDPDAPANRPWEAKADSELLANAFASWSARLAGRAAALAGRCRVGGASAHRPRRRGRRRRPGQRWGAHAVTTQTGCAVALRFGLVPAEERGDV